MTGRGRHWAGGARAGFTLAELLVGMLISSLILGAAAGVFVTSMDSWNRGERTYRLQQVAQTTGDLIERHLRSAVGPSGARSFLFSGEDLSNGDTYGHRLIFLSAAGGRLPRGEAPTDMSEVEFGFDPAEDDALTMRIDTTPDDELDAGGYNVTLTPLIKSFKVLYFDGTDWLEEWDDNKLPQAVEFHLTLADGDDGSGVGAGGGSGEGKSGAKESGTTGQGGSNQSLYTCSISRLIKLPADPAADNTSVGAATGTEGANGQQTGGGPGGSGQGGSGSAMPPMGGATMGKTTR